MKTNHHFPTALREFDSLPDSAFVKQPVVQGLFSCSAPTVWRRVKSGLLPAPKKFGSRSIGWSVGELRRALAK